MITGNPGVFSRNIRVSPAGGQLIRVASGAVRLKLRFAEVGEILFRNAFPLVGLCSLQSRVERSEGVRVRFHDGCSARVILVKVLLSGKENVFGSSR